MNYHRVKNILQQQHTLSDREWKGAVVFLCNDSHVFLIKRSDLMPTHGGQIAFFGGHKKSGETDPWIVAQREYEEETGFSSSSIDFLGYLPGVVTARGEAIVPVMARTMASSEAILKEARSNGEWTDVIAYPWEKLMDEESWNFAWRYGYGKTPVFFHTIEAKNYLSLNDHQPHLLWGATAGMIWDFLRLYFKHEASPY
jgi:8-oxo-dGTP pyrophosphatase MutT (NUDIX family)